MPALDVRQMIADTIDQRRSAGRGMLIGASIGWGIVLGLAGLVGWVISLAIGPGPKYFGGFVILICVGGTALLLASCVLFFYFNENAEIEIDDEVGFLDAATGNRRVAGEVGCAMFLFVPQITADGLRDLAGARGLPEEAIAPAQRIVDLLNEKNDWLPITTFPQSLDTLAELARLDIVWTKEKHGHAYVRLNPSLMD